MSQMHESRQAFDHQGPHKSGLGFLLRTIAWILIVGAVLGAIAWGEQAYRRHDQAEKEEHHRVEMRRLQEERNLEEAKHRERMAREAAERREQELARNRASAVTELRRQLKQELEYEWANRENRIRIIEALKNRFGSYYSAEIPEDDAMRIEYLLRIYDGERVLQFGKADPEGDKRNLHDLLRKYNIPLSVLDRK